MKVRREFVTHGNVVLALKCFTQPGVMPKRAVALIPGYGMNSFILGYHPSGPSLIEVLVSQGLEVWTFDLRGQGESRNLDRHAAAYGLADLALSDLRAAVEHVARVSEAAHVGFDLVGCSLGAAIMMGYLAHYPDAPIARIATLAGVVTWSGVHPLVRGLFLSSRLAGAVKIKHTRAIAKAALPTLLRFAPRLFASYINVESTDVSETGEMIKTVEDPSPRLNGEIAAWVKNRSLVVNGINVSASLLDERRPYLCVIADQDGIVPLKTALALWDGMGSRDKHLIHVGTPEKPIAHGDLFIGRGMQEAVFQPLARFLLGTSSS